MATANSGFKKNPSFSCYLTNNQQQPEPMLRCLIPAGHRIPIKAILRALIIMVRTDTIKTFETRLKDYLKVKHCFLTLSGTTALYLALDSLKELSSKNEVIMPAYACPSILAAVIKSGLKPVLCDLEENKSVFNHNELKGKVSQKTLAVISVHLFGISEDLQKIKILTSSHNIFHIEDSAQSFGTAISNRNNGLRPQCMPGTMGDIGIYSFGRGKPLTLMQGGALTTDSDIIAKAIFKRMDILKQQTSFDTFKTILKTLLYSVFSYPGLYWFPQRLPFLRLGETILNLNFELNRIDVFTSALGVIMISYIKKINMIRVQKAGIIYQLLASFKNYFLTDSQKNPVLLRFPVLLKNKKQKESVLSELKRRGVGATGMYPSPLNIFKDTNKYFNMDDGYKNALSFSERIITLPLHEYVTENDIDKTRKIMEKFLGNDDQNPSSSITIDKD